MTTTSTLPFDRMVDQILERTDDDRVVGSVVGAVEMMTEGDELSRYLAERAVSRIHRQVVR